jgi:glycosyltransferase involved in cell wall biosynthesis
LKEELIWGSGFNDIFSDNHSQDDSIEIARSYSSKFNNMKIINQEVNAGSRENWARLLEASTSDYFMFIDAHDSITNGYLAGLKSNIEQGKSGLILVGEKHKLLVADGFTSITADDFQYRFSKSPRIRFWQCVFYLSHCTEIHSAFPSSSRDAKILSKSTTFNFDHTYMFYALLNHRIAYIEGVGGYIRRYWDSQDANYSHKNSSGVSETRLQRAIGAQSKIVSNKSMPDEVLQHWGAILTEFEKLLARKLIHVKYNNR